VRMPTAPPPNFSMVCPTMRGNTRRKCRQVNECRGVGFISTGCGWNIDIRLHNPMEATPREVSELVDALTHVSGSDL